MCTISTYYILGNDLRCQQNIWNILSSFSSIVPAYRWNSNEISSVSFEAVSGGSSSGGRHSGYLQGLETTKWVVHSSRIAIYGDDFHSPRNLSPRRLNIDET